MASRHAASSQPAEPTPPPMSSDQPGVARARQTRGQTRAFYDRLSSIYDLLSERSEAPVRQAALEKLAPARGQHILELGCGTGPSLISLAKAVGPEGRVGAIDLSHGMLDRARARVRRAGLQDRFDLRQADAAKLPFGDAAFDGLLMTFTLELFDTPEIPDILAECRRVLRPGGRIVVAGVTKASGNDPLLSLFEWTHDHFPAVMDCRPIFVARALRSAGFLDVDTRHMHCWIPVEVVSATAPATAPAAAWPTP